MKITITCILALLCLNFMTYANGLEAGDKLPEVEVPNIINYTKTEINTRELRGKWLIIEFWAPWCSVCTGMLPKTGRLQQQYRDELTFFEVTRESATDVKTLYARLKSLQGLKPLIATDDRILTAMFDFQALPHYVWVDPEGTIIARTGKEAITEENIRAVINGNLVPGGSNKLPARDVPNTNEKTDDLQGAPVLYSSRLTGYKEGLKSRIELVQNKDEKGQRLIATNMPAIYLYKWAYGGISGEYLGRNRIMLEVADTTALIMPAKGEGRSTWIRKNMYCYEIIVPRDRSDALYELMKEDLRQYLPQYTATLEERKTDVLALVRTTKNDKIKTAGGETMVDIKPYGAYMTNAYLNSLVQMLNAKYMQHLPTPVVNMTGYSHKVDLNLNATLSNPEEVRQALQPYGLDLVEKRTMLKVLVIKDTQ